MPHPQTITPIDPKLIMRELDELDSVVHRLRARLEIIAPQKISHAHSRGAWSATHGVIGLERERTITKHIAQSRRKDAQRLAALLKLSKRHR